MDDLYSDPKHNLALVGMNESQRHHYLNLSSYTEKASYYSRIKGVSFSVALSVVSKSGHAVRSARRQRAISEARRVEERYVTLAKRRAGELDESVLPYTETLRANLERVGTPVPDEPRKGQQRLPGF